MCEPTTIMMGAALAISVASTAVSYAGQQQQASAQNKANQGFATSESAAAAANAIQQYGQGQRQITYQDAQATQKTTAEDMQAAAAMATAQANASARGVNGNSVDAIQRDYVNRRDTFNADVEYNRKASDDEIVAQMHGIQLGAQSQDNQIQSQNRFVQGPSPLSLIGGLGKDAANGYSMYTANKPPGGGVDSPTFALANNTPDAMTQVYINNPYLD